MNTPTSSTSGAPRFRGVALARTLLLAALSPLSLHALEIPYDYHVPCTPENAIFGHFSKDKKPVITVKSGAVVKIDGGGNL